MSENRIEQKQQSGMNEEEFRIEKVDKETKKMDKRFKSEKNEKETKKIGEKRKKNEKIREK